MKKYTLLFLFVIALTACSGGPTGGPGSETDNTERAAEGESDNQTVPLGDKLNIYNWADYIDTDLIEEYEQEYGVTINYDNYSNNEDLLAKLQTGVKGYDLIFPTDYMVRIMIELGLLAEIDVNDIPNFKNIGADFIDPPFDPGNRHCVPYQWGTTGIAYRTDHPFFADNPPDSWAYLYDPQLMAQYEDEGINMLNDQREIIGAGLIYLGYSYNDANPEHLDQVLALLLEAKPYWKTISSENYDDSLMVPGEVVISHAWSGDAASAYWKTYDEESGQSQWGFAIPKEGAARWVDSACIPANSENKERALHFMNYLLDAENGARITNFTYFASPNEASKPFIAEEILADPGTYPPDEVKNKLAWTEIVEEAVPLYNQIWTVIK